MDGIMIFTDVNASEVMVVVSTSQVTRSMEIVVIVHHRGVRRLLEDVPVLVHLVNTRIDLDNDSWRKIVRERADNFGKVMNMSKPPRVSERILLRRV